MMLLCLKILLAPCCLLDRVQPASPASSCVTPPGMPTPRSSALTHNCHTISDGCVYTFQGDDFKVKLIATARQKFG